MHSEILAAYRLQDKVRTDAIRRAISKKIHHNDRILICGSELGSIQHWCQEEGISRLSVFDKKDDLVNNFNYDVVIFNPMELLGIGCLDVALFLQKHNLLNYVLTIPNGILVFIKLIQFDYRPHDKKSLLIYNNDKIVCELSSSHICYHAEIRHIKKSRVRFQQEIPIINNGTFNAVLFSSVIFWTDSIVLGASAFSNWMLLVPVEETVLQVGQKISLNVNYLLTGRFSDIKIAFTS